MSPDRKSPRNPLVLDDDYDKLFDEDFMEDLSVLEESDPEYDHLLGGGRRRKPIDYSDF